MRLLILILWLSILPCANIACAQTISCPQVSKADDYDARWVDVASVCIKELISRAKLKRKEIWNERFPNLETLCRDYEIYWWRANVYADDVGADGQTKDKDWVKLAMKMQKSSKRNVDADRQMFNKFKRDITEFAGASSFTLVNRALLRFEPGQSPKLSLPVRSTDLKGDFYFPSKNEPKFWGEGGKFK